MNELYPLKFEPILQYRIWGGNKLNAFLPQESQMENLGEIWSLSGVPGNLSQVENGSLKGKDLGEIIRTYRENLLGEKTYRLFGEEFPLLIKFIDTAKPLSVQVHPGDELAGRLHNSAGKSEMWYIMEAEKDAELIVGFEKGIQKQDYLKHLESETLEEILHKVHVRKDDVVYIPAGRVHAIGKGIVLAEIQQTSDITYRIYDYNRIDKDGKKRELHTDLALEAIDFNPIDKIKTEYSLNEDEFSPLIDAPYFSTRVFRGNKPVKMNGNGNFRIYLCTEGKINFKTSGSETQLRKYESVLVPAAVPSFEILPETESVLIEVKVPEIYSKP